MNLDKTRVYKDLIAGVLPGIQIVPSGVWALGRAQEMAVAISLQDKFEEKVQAKIPE